MTSPSIPQCIRRNHALEHATVHTLSSMGQPLSLVGRSDWGGFSLYGEIDTAQIRWAVEQALALLRAGHHDLAIHPRCGTNIAATAMLSGGAIWGAAAIPERSNIRRWARVVVAGLAALALGHSFGLAMQRHITTDATMGNLEIRDIRRTERGGMIIHRVRTVQN